MGGELSLDIMSTKSHIFQVTRDFAPFFMFFFQSLFQNTSIFCFQFEAQSSMKISLKCDWLRVNILIFMREASNARITLDFRVRRWQYRGIPVTTFRETTFSSNLNQNILGFWNRFWQKNMKTNPGCPRCHQCIYIDY